MSNQSVGAIYAQIMERVIKASEDDFEVSGVDQATLQELSSNWQKSLTNLHVANFPWDPAPPPQQIPNPPTVPSNVSKPESTPIPSTAPAQPPTNANYGGPRIKQEPSYESQMPGYPQMNGVSSGLDGHAAQRAAALLHQRYGSNIGYQQQQQQQQQQRQNPGLALPGQAQGQQRPQFNLQLPGQGQQQRPQQAQVPQRQNNGFAQSQTDGAGDDRDEWAAIMAARKAQDEEGTRAADKFLREQLDAMAEQMDSGLMLPLAQQSKGKKRKAARKPIITSGSTEASLSTQAPFIPQLDGEIGYEEEDTKVEADEDAINSDLDDPEDELDKTGDEEIGDIMLCTYDKVQRVKNKWKCTLKDGVLNSGGRDYLFHKATGEFEW